jgi:membrane fusion protein (multidrug efflux system)
MPRFVTLTGTILADRQSEVAANVAGRILATYIERGQPVKQGQALAVVDGKTASLSAAAAAAQQKAAETQMALAVADCERADRLFQQGAATKAEYERLKTQCAAQMSTADAARANAGVAAKLAGDAVIRAPLDGVVGERYVNVGEYVQPMTKVASVYAIDPVRVSISVPEHEVASVQRGQSVDVQVAAYGGRVFPGTVRYIAPALRPQTRDLIVEAVVANKDGALKAGMFATVRLLVGTEEQLTVPEAAVKAEEATRRLFVARNKKAVELVVRVGETRDGRVAILDDLQPTDQVVINPPPALRDGTALQ